MPRLDAAHAVLKLTGIPRGWREISVGDMVRIVGGGTPDRNESAFWRNGTVPWITPTDLTANDSKYVARGAEAITELAVSKSNARLVPPGSIIFSTRGTVGNTAIARVALTCNQSCEVFVPRERLAESEFLFYLLNFGLFAFIRLSGGTTFGALTRRDLARVHFAVPSRTTEQAAIARILDTADTAIERTRAAVARARELDSALVHDLLERGLDDHGKLRSGGRADVVRTAVGVLPKAWHLSRVGDEFDLQNGFTLNEAVHTHGPKRRYLRVANVQRDELRLADVQELHATDRAFAPRMLEVGDLLVVEGHADRMQIGRCARVNPEARGMTFQNHLFRLRSRGRVTSEFAALWLNSAHARRYWNARCATSSGLNTINQRMLKRLDMPVPSKREQERIAELIAASRRRVGSLVAKEVALTQLKKSLMHDLLTGRVRVGGFD